jgi:hypothetical protein
MAAYVAVCGGEQDERGVAITRKGATTQRFPGNFLYLQESASNFVFTGGNASEFEAKLGFDLGFVI